jgi:hypothetical protein
MAGGIKPTIAMWEVICTAHSSSGESNEKRTLPPQGMEKHRTYHAIAQVHFGAAQEEGVEAQHCAGRQYRVLYAFGTAVTHAHCARVVRKRRPRGRFLCLIFRRPVQHSKRYTQKNPQLN